MKIAIYVRVSTPDQSLDLQLDEARAMAAARGWDVVETYQDHGFSGTLKARPGLTNMMQAAKAGKFKAVLVWRSDRLFRSLSHMLSTLEALKSYGIGFVSVRETFDTTTPQGKLMLHMISAFAEFERAIIVERVNAGLAAAKRRGKKLGRRAAKIDMETLLVMKNDGQSVSQMAEVLGVSRPTISKALKLLPTLPKVEQDWRE